MLSPQPDHFQLRPTTHPSTNASVRNSHVLVVEVYFTTVEHNDSAPLKVLFASVFRREVTVGSYVPFIVSPTFSRVQSDQVLFLALAYSLSLYFAPSSTQMRLSRRTALPSRLQFRYEGVQANFDDVSGSFYFNSRHSRGFLSSSLALLISFSLSYLSHLNHIRSDGWWPCKCKETEEDVLKEEREVVASMRPRSEARVSGADSGSEEGSSRKDGEISRAEALRGS